MKIERTSPFTGATRFMDIDVTEEQLIAWQSGTLVQDAMPNISAGEREFIMTGITETEWGEVFSEDEDDEQAADEEVFGK